MYKAYVYRNCKTKTDKNICITKKDLVCTRIMSYSFFKFLALNGKGQKFEKSDTLY